MKHTVLAALNRQQQPNHYQNFLTVAGKTINSFLCSDGSAAACMIKRQVQCTLLQFNVCVCCHISSLSTNSLSSLTSVEELERAESIWVAW